MEQPIALATERTRAVTTHQRQRKKDDEGCRGLQHHRLSIRDFTDSTTLSSRNTGVVEIMILHVCDKCIYSKTKWLLAMEIGRNTLQHLHPGMDFQSTRGNVQIILETSTGEDRTIVQDCSHIDPTLSDMELTLNHQTAVFSRLLLRYGLWDILSQQKQLEFLKQDSNGIDWRQCSFTMLRGRLTDHFATRTKPLPLMDINKSEISTPRDSNQGSPTTTGVTSYNQLGRSRKPNLTRSQSSIPRVAQSLLHFNSPSVLSSPFTPLTHDMLLAALEIYPSSSSTLPPTS
ncbi:hypothetical protein BASA62_010182 [Batrachochytrium salamandrivorans]|nr:hypothetical protein BASA62_010182 [Batrachochytrium salamandrivorans]